MRYYTDEEIKEYEKYMETNNIIIDKIFITEIRREFQGKTLNDEQFSRIKSFAKEIKILFMKHANFPHALDILDAMRKHITKNCWLYCKIGFNNSSELLYILACEQIVYEALIFYQLLPIPPLTNVNLIAIPFDNKNNIPCWFAPYKPKSDLSIMPEIGKPILYIGEKDDITKPIILKQEWCFNLN